MKQERLYVYDLCPTAEPIRFEQLMTSLESVSWVWRVSSHPQPWHTEWNELHAAGQLWFSHSVCFHGLLTSLSYVQRFMCFMKTLRWNIIMKVTMKSSELPRCLLPTQTAALLDSILIEKKPQWWNKHWHFLTVKRWEMSKSVPIYLNSAYNK